MKTLSEIKDQVAKDGGFGNWDNLCFVWAGFSSQIQPYSDKVAKRYAEEAVKECAERAKTKIISEYEVLVDRDYILNIIKELK